MPYADRNGTQLFYTDEGTGDPALLFVHGWCCNSTNWKAQVLAFRRRHRVVTVDLRGHGRSDKPEQDYAIDGFAEDLEWLIGQLDLRRPVVIGHSMGGLIALFLARRKKRPLSAIVLVDGAMHLAMSQQQIDGLLQGLDTPAYRDVAKIIIDGFFRSTTSPAFRTEITESLLSAPKHVMVPALKSLAAEMRPESQDIGIPALFIDAGRSFDELNVIQETVPGMEIARTNGAGHFNMIEAPEQVNAMLRTFLDQLPPVGAGLQARARNTT